MPETASSAVVVVEVAVVSVVVDVTATSSSSQLLHVALHDSLMMSKLQKVFNSAHDDGSVSPLHFWLFVHTPHVAGHDSFINETEH